MLIHSVAGNLRELETLLNQISDAQYSDPCRELSNSSIGQHTRHIIEMFRCLENSYDSGIVEYDDRPRDKKIETNKNFASEAILSLIDILDKPNKTVRLRQSINGEKNEIETNYFRELLYNLEHCIHHQALIKVALLQYNNITVSANFGVAPSTIEYRSQCAQ